MRICSDQPCIVLLTEKDVWIRVNGKEPISLKACLLYTSTLLVYFDCKEVSLFVQTLDFGSLQESCMIAINVPPCHNLQ